MNKGLVIVILVFMSSFAFGNTEAEYKIGVDDVINVSVWQYEQFNTSATVGPDGKITIPLLGHIYAEGLTRDELKNEVTKGLSKYIKEGAEVTISIAQYRSQKISIFGQVKNPRTITVSSIPSFLEIITQSEFTPEADLTAVKIIPADPSVKNIIIVNVSEILQSGNIAKFPELHSGDTIYVPKTPVVVGEKPEERPAIIIQNIPATPPPELTGKEKFVIHVAGSVRTPSTLEFSKEPTLMEVLLKAGSVNDNEALSYVRVVRGDPTASGKVVDVNLKEYLNNGNASVLPKLQSGDIVYIPDLAQEKLKDLSIIITGQVLKPGTYRINESLNILDAVSLAGGLTENADAEMVRVRKESGDLYQEKVVNLDEFLKDVGSTAIPEMVGPGYRIYVPTKRASISNIAYGARGLMAFLVDLTVVYGFFRLIKD